MSKGAVFFSHSSADADALRRLKQAVVAKTGGSVDIFLSSDGQSVRLGHNWVSEIEQALTSASLMFVFISPVSAASQWVFFEAGHAYARRVKVIPVAMGGADLGRMRPPISLLQGFNLTSANQLNNILQQINEQFGHTHALTFTQADFEEIFPPARVRAELVRGYVPWVEAVLIDTRIPFADMLPHIVTACGSHDLDFQADDWEVLTYGARYSKIHVSDRDRRFGNEWLRAEFAPSEGATHCQVLRDAASAAGAVRRDLSVSYYLVPSVYCVRQRNQLTARLRGSEIRLGPNSNFAFDNTFFRINYGNNYLIDDLPGDRVWINVDIAVDDLPAFDLTKILNILFRVGALFSI